MFVTAAEVKAIIDEAFVLAEGQLASHPFAVSAMKFANTLVDNSGIPAAVAAAINSLLVNKGVKAP